MQEPEKYIDLVIKNKENMAAFGGNINNEILERYDVVIAMDRQSNLNIAEHAEINQLEQNLLKQLS